MKTLALAMIVKNESRVIKRCLDSVKGIIDSYVIIEDTKSTDNTVEIIRDVLKDIPGEIIIKDWAGFGETRNYYIEEAKGKADYILVMDADQVLEVDKDFDKDKLDKDIYNCIVKYPTLQHHFPKIFKPDCGCKYKGIIHNFLSTNKATVGQLNNIRFMDLHDGKRAMNYSTKIKRDIEILKNAIKTDPENKVRYTFYLAQSLREDGRYQQAIRYYRKRVNFGGWQEEVYRSLYQIGNCYLLLKDNNKAITSYLKAYNYRPTRAEAIFKLTLLYRNLGQRQLAYEFSRIGIGIKYPKLDVLFVEQNIYSYLMLFEYSIALYYVGKYAESIRVCNRIDSMTGIPKSIKEQNIKNREFSLNKISEWSMDKEMYNWIRRNIPRGSTILELGSGKSTIDLAKDYKVYSVEHDKEWLNLTNRAKYIYASIKNGWYDVDILKKELPTKYDIILVDGPPGYIGRKGFYENLKLFNTKVPILIDDTNRGMEKQLLENVSKKLRKKYVEYNTTNKKFAVINYKEKKPIKYDIIFYDDVTTPFTSRTWKERGVGASILEASLLLTELAKEKKVLAFSRTDKPKVHDRILWKNYNNCYNYECDTLIVFRYSSLPPIKYKRLIVWAHDAPPLAHKHLFEALNKDNATLITVSDWQKSLFEKYVKNIETIKLWLPDWIYNYKAEKDKNKYIYASANVKGLDSTIKLWSELKKDGRFIGAKLYVCTPGYDKVNEQKLKEAGIVFLGSLSTLEDVIREIASSVGMFYVNDFPETFGVSPYLAEILGCRTHILCTKGYGALREAVNSDLLTDDKDKFMREILEAHENGGHITKPNILTKNEQYGKWKAILAEKREVLLKNYNKVIWIDTSITNNDVSNQRFLWNGNFYEEELLEFSRKLKLDKNKVIVDVGANIGNHTIFFSLFCPHSKIFAFEPYDKVRKVLENHIKMNKLRDIKVFPYAVGAKAGFCDLEKSPSGSGIEYDGRTYIKEGNSIKMITLDEVLKDEEISLIKIDVEDYEYNVLQGAKKTLQKCHPYLFIEAKSAILKQRIDNYLASFGYKSTAQFNPYNLTYFYEVTDKTVEKSKIIKESDIPKGMYVRNFVGGKEGLQELISGLPKECVMVEVGSYIGESTELFAKKCKRVYAIDPWKNYYDGDDKSFYQQYPMELIEQAFDIRMKKFNNVIKIKGESAKESKKSGDKAFNFVYIDGNHQYENVKEDIETWLPKIKPNGMIGGHDYGYLPDVTKAVDEIFGKQRIETFKDTSWLVRLGG